jgi:DNA ligase-1
MTFRILAEYFLKLEQTASRNEMVVILAELFKEAAADEIDKVVYLTQGRVAPLYEPVEFGMAEKMVIRAMALSSHKSVDEVTKLYKKSGDLGVTAESLSKKSPFPRSITEIFLQLKLITETGGEGSVERKIKILADLFKESSALENRFLARIPVDKMRLGFSDMTILEGLSWMICGSKDLKNQLEAKYNVRPDLGFIARQAKIHNASFTVEPAVGTPILSMRAERLTSPAEILEKMGQRCAVEPKLDGLRTQLHFSKQGPRSMNQESKLHDLNYTIQLFSRGLENVTKMYPDLVEAAVEELDCEEIILDGEAIGFDPATGKYLPFQETVQRKRKHEISLFAESVPLKLVVFDILFLNGKSLMNEPYETRRSCLEAKIAGPTLVLAEMKIVNKPEELSNYFEDCVQKGLEGIMAKKLDGVYQAGARGWNWIKYKASYAGNLVDTIDAVVMGIDFGQGKRNKFGVGAFLIGVFDRVSATYKTISKVGTGLTDEEWRELKSQSLKYKVDEKPKEYDVNKLNDCDVWVMPRLVGEFKGDELTKSPMHTAGYALRFPRLVRWREKKPQDATSLQELIKLAKLGKEKAGDKNEN